METNLNQLNDSPENWELRSSIAREFYEAGDYPRASELLLEAPEIPGDEDNIVFAATIIGATNVDTALSLLDHFVASHSETEAIATLRNHFVAPAEEPAASEEAPAVKESVAVPIAPTKLRPPGSEEEVEEDAPFVPATMTGAVATVAATAAPVETAGAEEEFVGESGERSFNVGEGEAVRAVGKGPDTKEKLSAILAAVIIHMIAIAALATWALAGAPNPPPQISVSSMAVTDDADMDNQTVKKFQQKTAAAMTSAQPVISSSAFSNFAVPDTFDPNANLAMVAMSSSDSGFGMSMSGFGDVSNMGSIPAGMRSRCSMSQRMKRLRESGGEDRAERAVRDGLEFITSQQNKDGSFGEDYPAAMTGLSLLAYLGHCETPESPKFGDSVVNAALFLMDKALKNDGLITNGKGGHHNAYEHAIATYALSELYTMTKESGKEIPRLESVLKKSVDVIVDCQSKEGGWPYYGHKGKEYGPTGGHDDMSVAGWSIQALKAAYNTGRKFSGVEKALDKAMEDYLPSIQDQDGAFKYSPKDAKGKQTLTGAALLAMQIWKGTNTPTYDKGFKYLVDRTQNPGIPGDFYEPYYNTQVFFMAEGKEWENYNKKFQPKLLDAQNEDGSWSNNTRGKKDGKILNAAWAILMLEVYYRYLPTTDKVEGLQTK
jgi:hypothetical protein